MNQKYTHEKACVLEKFSKRKVQLIENQTNVSFLPKSGLWGFSAFMLFCLASMLLFISVARAQTGAELRAGQTFQDCDICPQMVVVPGGSFTMGSPASEESRDDDESPQHRVSIKKFAVGKFEVTFGEWEACVLADHCEGYRPNDERWGRDCRPVINVDWDDARSYVSWLSEKTGNEYRLLSESEWEYVARAGTTGPFHFGSTISSVDQANYDGSYEDYGRYGSGREGVRREKTTPVGSFPPNDFGVYDMHGNVSEWIEDCWHLNYTDAPNDGSGWVEGYYCYDRVIRGGSWNDAPWDLRSANRDSLVMNHRVPFVGFRVARTMDESSLSEE